MSSSLQMQNKKAWHTKAVMESGFNGESPVMAQKTRTQIRSKTWPSLLIVLCYNFHTLSSKGTRLLRMNITHFRNNKP